MRLSPDPYECAERRNERHVPQPRPSNLPFGTLWYGIEPDLDDTFRRWERTQTEHPYRAFRAGLREFEAGDYIGYMSAESKTGLVHAVINAFLDANISPPHITLAGIQVYLADSYRRMVLKDQRLALSDHHPSFYPRPESREEELKWLKYQVTRRWNSMLPRMNSELKARSMEASESEANALFDAYTHHSELPSSSWM